MAGQSGYVKVDSGFGIIWFIGWLFTIGYANQSFWEGVLGLVIWPYYLALVLR